MRKTAAIIMLLALLIAIFASCGKDEETTTLPPLTGASTTAPSTTAYIPVASTQSNTNPTYILTTSPDKTVPWGETTAYNTTSPTTTAPTGIVIQIPTEGVTSPVQPSYSVAPTTAPTTPAPTTTTAPTTTKPTTTKPVVKKKVSVSTGSSAFSGEETLLVDIDGSNWSSQFVANTQYLPAYIDGNNTGKNVKCTLNSKPDSANNYTITVDVSTLSLSPGAVISISFPEGFIQTKAGTQYSSSFEINSTY
ncbi:MAG: hypothetical protein UHM85_08125 [Acutalibacteraceae bacterium]|nr:hypothetical protein [Acutalibacteraceae bacterium]